MTKVLAPYTAAISVNSEILTSAANIAYEVGRLSLSGVSSPTPALLAQEVEASLKEEGILLTPSQLRALRRGEEIAGRKEAKALFTLYSKIGRIRPCDPEFLTEFEKAMFPDGTPNRMGRKVEGFPYPLPLRAKIPSMMRGIYHFAQSKERHPLLVALLFYYEILAVQPYSQFSKTLATYLMKAILVSYSKEFAAIPLARAFYLHKEQIEKAYAESVASQDTAPFLKEAMRLLEAEILKAQRKSIRQKAESTPLVDRLLSLMEDGKYYKASELLALLGLTSRLGLAKNYLRPALASKRIEMANPLSPTDRNQRYRKVLKP
ncbi:MAG: hypothetical protein SPI58_05875 [Candidatus Enteromonas sp.]|nr:hypothetical protein [Candidatus Enteromonas sp.]